MSYGTYSLYIVLIAFTLLLIWAFLDHYFGENKFIKKIVNFVEYVMDSIIRL